jgi:hypothetical protein
LFEVQTRLVVTLLPKIDHSPYIQLLSYKLNPSSYWCTGKREGNAGGNRRETGGKRGGNKGETKGKR